MSEHSVSPVMEQLHAWVDGGDNTNAAEGMPEALSADPALSALARHYRRQNDLLRQTFSDALDEPVPVALVNAALGARARPSDLGGWTASGAATSRRRSADAAANAPTWSPNRWTLAGALAACLSLGVAIGIVSGRSSQPPGGSLGQSGSTQAESGAPLTRAAAIAHAAYVPEVRHPVEVGAGEQTHLVAWLSKRLGTALRVPDLQAQGLRLVGGRLLPDEIGGVAAQFMFEGASGQRLTLFVRHDAPGSQGSDTAFRFVDQGRLRTFYWIDHGFGYALSGELPRDAMLSVATAVYSQLNP